MKTSGDNSFLKSQIIDKDNIFFPELRKMRKMELEKSKMDWKWVAPFKIYPSSLQSFTMCPWAYFQSMTPPEFPLSVIYKMKAGSSKHQEYQNEFLNSKILYPKPLITDPVVLDKLVYTWPEVPFTLPDCQLSGRVDLVLMDGNGAPAPLEFKTTSIHPDNWENHKETQLPKANHIVQAASYCYSLNKLNYYPKVITKFCLAYQNLFGMPGDQDSEHELWFKYSEYEEKISLLIEHLTLERERFINGVESSCSYPLCKKHKKDFCSGKR